MTEHNTLTDPAQALESCYASLFSDSKSLLQCANDYPVRFATTILPSFVYRQLENIDQTDIVFNNNLELLVNCVETAAKSLAAPPNVLPVGESPVPKNESIDDQLSDFVDELAHHNYRYAAKPKGEKVAEAIRKGILAAKLADEQTEGRLEFTHLSKVTQAYWDRKACNEAASHRTHRTHRTIRINSLPFAEALFPWLMARTANDYGLRIDLIEVAWGDVGAALFTNRIDIAIYPDSITEQMKRLHGLLDGRLVYQSEPILRYRGYYLLSRDQSPKVTPEDFTTNNNRHQQKIAIVLNSDQETVLRSWLYGVTEKDLENLILPVKTPDEALSAALGGKADYCVAGALHKHYATEGCKIGDKQLMYMSADMDEAVALDPERRISPRLWAVSHRRESSRRLLRDILSLWAETCDQWRVFRGEQDDDLREQGLIYVNRSPIQAFATTPKKLQGLLVEHDELLHPDVDKFDTANVA